MLLCLAQQILLLLFFSFFSLLLLLKALLVNILKLLSSIFHCAVGETESTETRIS